MAADPTTQARTELAELLRGGHAHLAFDEVVAGFSADKRGVRLKGAPYSAWELLEHMRIAQWDILEFSRDPNHQSPKWPEAYWPSAEAPPDDKAWDRSVAEFKADSKAFQDLIQDQNRDLLKPFDYGEGQTLFREALTLADHNSYHLGQLALLRKQLGISL